MVKKCEFFRRPMGRSSALQGCTKVNAHHSICAKGFVHCTYDTL